MIALVVATGHKKEAFSGISNSDSASTQYEKVNSKKVIFPLSRTKPFAFVFMSDCIDDVSLSIAIGVCINENQYYY